MALGAAKDAKVEIGRDVDCKVVGVIKGASSASSDEMFPGNILALETGSARIPLGGGGWSGCGGQVVVVVAVWPRGGPVSGPLQFQWAMLNVHVSPGRSSFQQHIIARLIRTTYTNTSAPPAASFETLERRRPSVAAIVSIIVFSVVIQKQHVRVAHNMLM